MCKRVLNNRILTWKRSSNFTMLFGTCLTNLNESSGFVSFIYFVSYALRHNLNPILVVNIYPNFDDDFSTMSYSPR